VVTNQELVEWFNISSSYTASWESTYPVFTQNAYCKVKSSEFNSTQNPTACQTESALSGSLSYSGGLPKNNVTGSEFSPYVTTVGLYNDAHELVAVAKLGQPIPKSKTNDMTFVVKFDIYMWLFKDEVIESIEEMPQDTYGFIYLVTHLPSNRKYIGKKVLYFERNVKLGKKELEALKEERKAKGMGGRAPLKRKW
jgi:hypothetical protein